MVKRNIHYKYITANNKVIAISKFEGKPIRGIAKCSPEDTFDFEYGKKLATLRCAEKVAIKRAKRALDLYDVYDHLMNTASENRVKYGKYLKDAAAELAEIRKDLKEFEN